MRLNIICLVLFTLAIFQGCAYEAFDPKGWAVDPDLELSESGLVFNAAKNLDTIFVKTNYTSYDITCDDSWCHYKKEKLDSIIIVEVDPNMTSERRRTTINITIGRGNKRLTKKVSVVQMGGYWDVIGQFSVYWSSEVTTTQKETISDILNSMVYVKGGTFVMGRNYDSWWEKDVDADYRHKVTLSDFFINKTEVTQKQWNVIMGSNNSRFKGEKLPVENIEWDEALEFVSKLSKLTNLSFVLPTEAQWEYAARGGIYSMGYEYPGSDDYRDVMIYKGDGNPSDPSFSTCSVAQLDKNELGLYDMAGNVAEMCSDWYGHYKLYDQIDPMGPATGEYHVIRGGDFTDYWSIFCTVYSRYMFISKNNQYVGIRLCLRP